MNILFLFLEIIFASSVLIILFKKNKYDGMYLWILTCSMLLGLMSQKIIEIFNLEINLDFAINSLIIVSSNIIIQKKGPEEIGKILSIIILSNVTLYTFSIISSLTTISNIQELSNNSFNELFYLNNRIYFASIISLLISLWLNSKIYHKVRQTKNKIWISNFLSAVTTNLIESTLFCLIAYIFKISIINIIELIIIRYIFKLIIGLIGTNIIHILNSIER